MSEREVVGMSNGHIWSRWVLKSRAMICCDKCGIIRRADDKNTPCKGYAAVEMRDE